WFSSNSVDNSLQSWKPSEWRQDSRLELIFEQPQDLEVLRAGLQSCLMKEGG
ncbi:MAG: cobalamin biosynthesis protein CobW, partial [Pseudomonas sp.]|nr:cobalamin biosynthesis protein CobW [Pseudomonas sp.]